MTNKQLKQVALAAEAMYLLHGATIINVTNVLQGKDVNKFRDVQMQIALGWLRQAGFRKVPESIEEIVNCILVDQAPVDPPKSTTSKKYPHKALRTLPFAPYRANLKADPVKPHKQGLGKGILKCTQIY
jgi:hypothetical protein